MTPELSLIMPLYNEEAVVRQVAEQLSGELQRAGIDYELVLVNNGSTDRTADVLSELALENARVTIATVDVNQGYGWGIIAGLRAARGQHLGFLCGDGQISPADTIKVYRKLIAEKLDICKVKRIVRKDGTKRLITSKIYNFIFPIFFPVKTSDVNGTPKIMHRRRYKQLDIKSKDWFIDAEVMIKAQRLGFKVGEVPVVFEKREEGSSSVNYKTVLEFIKNLLKYRIRGV